MHIPPVSLTSHITRCAVADRHHSLSFPPSDSTAVPIQTCTAHDLPSSKYSVEDILQIILKTRKSWKTLRGQSEAVWPPYLEATMLKALQEYEPDDSRETRMLGRYPMRNRFISDYVHRTTGKYRSAKQVGSRLQQLRDTSEGRDLIDVLTRCYRTRMDTGTCGARVPVWQQTSLDDSSPSPSVSAISCDSPSTTSSGSPLTPASSIMPQFPQPRPRQSIESRMPVYIDILPQHSRRPSMGYGSLLDSAAPPTGSNSRPADAMRYIHDIDPTVTFVSPSPVNGKSSYIVLLDGAPVHTEHTMLVYAGPYSASPTGQTPGDERTLYNTTLVPKYWDVLCGAADPTLYSIVQDVYCIPNPVRNQDHLQHPRPIRIFSAIYYFKYPSADSGSTSPYGQSVGPSSSSASMTSAFGDQTLQGSTSTDLIHAAPYHLPTIYPVPTSDSSRAPTQPTQVEQNLFDEPFMLDVNFDQVTFDDFFVNMDASSEGAGAASSHFFSPDPNRFYM